MANVVPKSLYPRKDSLEEAEQVIRTQLPITTQNELTAALALYHNTLLHVTGREISSHGCQCTP